VVSVDYLIRPLEIFKEVNRVLRPGGKFILSQSNRCFPTKAIAMLGSGSGLGLEIGTGTGTGLGLGSDQP